MVLEALASLIPVNPGDYWLTRFVFLRILGLTYLFAFISLARQVIPLLGESGLTPVSENELKRIF